MLSQSGSRTISKGERATDHLQSRSFASRAFRALAQDDRPPDALKKKTKERREEKHGFSFLFLYPRNGHCHPERPAGAKDLLFGAPLCPWPCVPDRGLHLI